MWLAVKIGVFDRLGLLLLKTRLCLEACPARHHLLSAVQLVKACPEDWPQCLQVFMDKEAGPEGAEIPSAAAAAGGAADVSMDYKRFWRELGEILGMQPGIHILQKYETFPKP